MNELETKYKKRRKFSRELLEGGTILFVLAAVIWTAVTTVPGFTELHAIGALTAGSMLTVSALAFALKFLHWITRIRPVADKLESASRHTVPA